MVSHIADISLAVSSRSPIISVCILRNFESVKALTCSIGASMIDGGWSKWDEGQAIAQLNTIIRVVTALDKRYAAGKL